MTQLTYSATAYAEDSNTLTITGSNLDTLLQLSENATTDIKASLDWSKLVWNINRDSDTSNDVTFALSDIASVKATDATHLTIVLTDDKAAALEGSTGYGCQNGYFSASDADFVEITAGFAQDTPGNTVSTSELLYGTSTVIYGTSKAETQFHTLLSATRNVIIPKGEVVKVFDVAGAQIFTVQKGGTLHLSGALGNNVVTLSDLPAAALTVSRSGSTVYFWTNGQEVASIATNTDSGSTQTIKVLNNTQYDTYSVHNTGSAIIMHNAGSSTTVDDVAIGLVAVSIPPPPPYSPF